MRLILTNRASKADDSTSAAFFGSSRIIAGRAPGGEVSLDAGETKIIDLIPPRGAYQVHCGKFGHKMLGMRTTIIVG